MGIVNLPLDTPQIYSYPGLHKNLYCVEMKLVKRAGNQPTQEELEELIEDADRDGSGSVDFQVIQCNQQLMQLTPPTFWSKGALMDDSAKTGCTFNATNYSPEPKWFHLENFA